MNNRILYTPKERKYTGKRKKTYNLWMIIGVGLCIIFVVLSVITVRLPVFQIQKIFISGLSTVNEEDVRKEVTSALVGSYFAGLISYRFLFAVPTQTIVDAIKHKFSLIAEVHIEKEFPDTLTIGVKERTMFGILCNDAANLEALTDKGYVDIQCAYVDTQGVAYESAPKTHGFLITKISTDAPMIAIGQVSVDPLMMQRITDLNTKLPAVIGSPIVEYRLRGNVAREVRVVSNMGFSLIINRDDDLDHALSVLGTILKKEIGSKRKNLDYIDLRFGNKVFYKFK